MPDILEQRQYEQGYRERMEVLRSGQMPLVDALHATVAFPNDCYHRGADKATEDYIKELEKPNAAHR